MREFIEGMIATERAVCPVCGEQQYKDINIAEEGCEEVWVRMRAICTCEYEKRQEAERTIKRLERQSRIDYLKRRHLPEKRLHGFTFDTDDRSKSEASIICRRYVDRWQTVKENGYGLLLHGNVGTGKTFYAACIVNAMIEKGIAAELTTITRLINTIAIENRDVALAELNRLPLIVIDDLGAERQTEYSREMAFTVIDERIKSKRPLIVTTNLSPDEMVQADDMSQLRTYERVLEACPIRVGLTGRSRRRSDDKQKVETAMKDLFS